MNAVTRQLCFSLVLFFMSREFRLSFSTNLDHDDLGLETLHFAVVLRKSCESILVNICLSQIFKKIPKGISHVSFKLIIP